MLKAIAGRGVNDLAQPALQTSGQVFRYAIAHGLAKRNPATDIKPSDVLPSRHKQNMARIDGRELPELMRRIDAYQGTPVTRMAMKLMAMTFVRTTELIGARWDEFDLDGMRWDIPASRMKMKTPHIVPMSTQAVSVLKTLHPVTGHSPMLFPGERDHEKSMSNNTILKALGRMGRGPDDRPWVSRSGLHPVARDGVRTRPHRAPTCPPRPKRGECGVQPCNIPQAAVDDDATMVRLP